jgi:hypothetical protein
VVEVVREYFADAEGVASLASGRREAEHAVETAQAALDRAIAAFSALGDEPAAIAKLGELRDARDAARERLAQLGPASDTLALGLGKDWSELSFDEQRALIKALVNAVMIRRGRGEEKIGAIGLTGDLGEPGRILGGAARRILGQ